MVNAVSLQLSDGLSGGKWGSSSINDGSEPTKFDITTA